MVQALEQLSKIQAPPRGGGIAITEVSSRPDNEVRTFTIKWRTLGIDRVLIFLVRLAVTYDNGQTATIADIVGKNRRSVDLSVSEIQGQFRVVSFNVTVTALVFNLNPPQIEMVTAQRDGQIAK